jgi:hypothetical protein
VKKMLREASLECEDLSKWVEGLEYPIKEPYNETPPIWEVNWPADLPDKKRGQKTLRSAPSSEVNLKVLQT